MCVTIEAAARASAENRRLPLDVVLVLDRSSSMSGAKIELCKATVSFVLDEMRLCDRIALVSYGSDVRDEFGGLVAVAPDARRRCKGVVAQLRPGKRTNLSGGVLEGLEILRSVAARSEPAEGEPSRRSTPCVRDAKNATRALVDGTMPRRSPHHLDAPLPAMGTTYSTTLLLIHVAPPSSERRIAEGRRNPSPTARYTVAPSTAMLSTA